MGEIGNIFIVHHSPVDGRIYGIGTALTWEESSEGRLVLPGSYSEEQIENMLVSLYVLDGELNDRPLFVLTYEETSDGMLITGVPSGTVVRIRSLISGASYALETVADGSPLEISVGVRGEYSFSLRNFPYQDLDLTLTMGPVV